jgi:hypothetical protein
MMGISLVASIVLIFIVLLVVVLIVNEDYFLMAMVFGLIMLLVSASFGEPTQNEVAKKRGANDYVYYKRVRLSNGDVEMIEVIE